MRKLGSSLMIFGAVALAGAGAGAARPAKGEKAGMKLVLVLRLEGGGLPDDLVQKLDTHGEHLRGLCGAAHMCSITRPDNRASGLGLPDNV